MTETEEVVSVGVRERLRGKKIRIKLRVPLWIGGVGLDIEGIA